MPVTPCISGKNTTCANNAPVKILSSSHVKIDDRLPRNMFTDEHILWTELLLWNSGRNLPPEDCTFS
jgi:hypothetical protein